MSAPMNEVKKPTFFAYLLAFFLPPLYFFSRKRIGAGIISLILFIVSIPLLFFVVGFFIWLFDAAWAIWNLKHEMLEAHIQDQAYRIAKAMKEEKAA